MTQSGHCIGAGILRGGKMSEKIASRYYRERASHHHGSAQECLDYAALTAHPKLRKAWERVAGSNQELAVALEHLASVTDEIEAEANPN